MIELTPVQPPNCYNCGMRNGYPFNLGGDNMCKNFILITALANRRIDEVRNQGCLFSPCEI